MQISREPIAIVGTGCRFPGDAKTPSALWDILIKPRDLSQPLSSRFDTNGWHHENGKHHGHCNVKRSYLLSGETSHRKFDAQFFGISAVEANTVDPQMRLLLETVYEALEAAGIPMEDLRGSDTAVYSGVRAFCFSILTCSITTSFIAHKCCGIIKNRIGCQILIQIISA